MIIKNSAMCLLCYEEIESKNRHDFVSCKCNNISVDGGKEYIKRSVMDMSKFKDTSILKEE